MATFTPPLRDGNPMTAPGDHPGNPIMRHYGPWAQGVTVWKDSLGVYHESMTPYQGGATHATHNNWVNGSGPISTLTAPDEGLATATQVYLGGHTYELTAAQEADLVANGYSLGGHNDTEELAWINYCLTNEDNKDYRGGDGCSSLKRPGGESLWFFADTLIGDIEPSGMYGFVLPTRNSFIVRNPDNSFGEQVFASGGTGPAFAHPDGSHWWWAIDVTHDSVDLTGDVVVACWDVTSGGIWGHLVENTLLTLNIFGGVASTVAVSAANETFFVQSIYTHSDGFHYVLGLEYDKARGGYDTYTTTTQTFTRLARVATGSLRTPAAWTYWDGSGWNASATQARRITDSRGNLIEGNATITRSNGLWVLAAQATTDPSIRLYRSSSPQGPWSLYHVETCPQDPIAGAVPSSPAHYAYYLPKFHEHFNTANNLSLSYNRNIFTLDQSSPGPAITALHVSTFCPQFLWLPPA